MESEILYQDKHILLCAKPAGVPSQPDPSGQEDLLSSLQRNDPAVRLIHRLDTPTGGVMVFSRTPEAASYLSAAVQDHSIFQKEYLAILPAPPTAPEGQLRDYLFHDKRTNKSFVTENSRKGSKEAILSYRTLQTLPDGQTLLLVRLHTGRTHQIRIQFASRGLPLIGDGKYGSRKKAPFIALWAYRLTFPHPKTKTPVTASSKPSPEDQPWTLFSDTLQNL